MNAECRGPALIAVMMTACVTVSAHTHGISATEQPNARTVVEKFFDAYRARNVDQIVALMSPVIAFEDPTFRLSANGREEVRKMATALRSMYSDVAIELHSVIVSGDRVAVELTVAATIAEGDKRRRVKVRGASFFVVRQGLVEKWTDYFDYQTFTEQTRKP